MKTQTDIAQEKETTPIQRVEQEASDGGTAQLADNRESTIYQRKLQEGIHASTENSTIPIQRKNNTGLPDNLKTGIENLSGYSMDDVKVHYNSSKPAQLQAHAYAQGREIHLAPGQEKHLPHEAWHVVQQKQGRVKPTMQFKGKVNINDDVGLEKEADVMGARALNLSDKNFTIVNKKNVLINNLSSKNSTIQGYFSPTGLQSQNTMNTFNQWLANNNYPQADQNWLNLNWQNMHDDRNTEYGIREVISSIWLNRNDYVPGTAGNQQYDIARNAAILSADIAQDANYIRLGGGLNKTAYSIGPQANAAMTILIGRSASLIHGEIRQILNLSGQNVRTPDLYIQNANDAIFTVNHQGVQSFAFIQEYIPGFEIPRAGTGFSSSEIRTFGTLLLNHIVGLPVNQAQQAALNIRQDIGNIRTYWQNVGSIPDFQVRLDTNTDHLLVLDPGDDHNETTVRGLDWLLIWENQIDQGSLYREWNKRNPNNQRLRNFW